MGVARITLPKGENDTRRQALLYGIALILLLSTTPVMNTHVFPLYDEALPFARDISVISGAIFAGLFALCARWKPGALKALASKPCIAASIIACTLLFYGGLALKIAAVLFLGAILLSVMRMGVAIMVGVALSRLPQRIAHGVIALSFLVSSVLSYFTFFSPSLPMVIFFAGGSIVAFFLALPPSSQIISSSEASDSPLDLSSIRPESFVPFSGSLFVVMLFFVVARGYSLRFDGADGSARSYVISFVIIGLIMIISYARKKHFSLDTLIRISLFVIVAGFFAILLQRDGFLLTPTAFISGGYSVFEMVTWIALVSLAAKNPLDAFPVMAWGRAVMNFGVVIGAQLGNLSTSLYGSSSQILDIIVFALVLIYIGFEFFVMRFCSFDQAVSSVVPLTDQAVSENTLTATTESGTPLIDERCALIGQQHGLTSREIEIFTMLAKGRNSAYIQEKLVISRNTTKTHVKHVYQKLGIHSHQELINFVEQV